MADVRIKIPLTPRQRQMVESLARILHIGCGTKTGKSLALAVWVMDGLLAGEQCAWVGPWFARARTAFETIKNLLAPLIESGEVKVSEGVLRIRHVPSGGFLDFYSADNAQSLFGGNYHRVVLDEASRMPEAIFAAACTVISATNGKLRCAFNLELGSRNWAIRNLLRVQAMTPEQRAASGEDFLMFPTGGDGLVPQSLIDMLRSQMPEPLWRALYLAEIPESDVSLFRNLDKVFAGAELAGPLNGHYYCGGVDLGRKQDFTVVTIIDTETGCCVATDRFHQISWTLQCERVAGLCRQFRCSKVFCDATGIGDPLSEQLSALGVEVEPFVFTAPSRKQILEQLVVAFDNCGITIPSTEPFVIYKRELESFEYVLDGTTVKYAAPANMHDDCVMSLALAWHGVRASGQGELGLIELLRRGFSGYVYEPLKTQWKSMKRDFNDGMNAKSQAPETVELSTHSNCPLCGSTRLTTAGHNWILCGGCGKYVPLIAGTDETERCELCGSPCTRIGGSGVCFRCTACAQQFFVGAPPEALHVSRRDLASGRFPIRTRRGF